MECTTYAGIRGGEAVSAGDLSPARTGKGAASGSQIADNMAEEEVDTGGVFIAARMKSLSALKNEEEKQSL